MSQPPLSLPGPLFLCLAAAVLAVLAYAAHRWSLLSGLVAAAGCLGLGWMCLERASERPVTVLGRDWALTRSFALWGQEWALTPSALAVLTLILFICGLAFLLALPVSQGWSFYPFGLGVVSVLILAVAAQQHTYRVLFLWLAANLAVFVLSGGRPGATMGALRFLILTSIGVMPLLVLPQYLEAGATGEAMQTATILAVIGFGILLMMFPFHGQLAAIASHSAPMVPSVILSAFPLVVLYILFQLAHSFPLLLDPLFFDVCRWLGIAVVAIGGLSALGQRQWGYLLGHAALVDWGAGLIALAQGTPVGMERILHMLIWRACSLLLAGTGLSILFKAAGKKDELASCAGLLRRRPLAVLAAVYGLLSLGAFPLTPGAAGRWPLILDLLRVDPRTAWVLILAGAGVCAGTLTGVRACLGRGEDEEKNPSGRTRERLESLVSLGFATLAFWLAGTLFLRPGHWLELTQRVLEALTLRAG